MAYIYKDFVNRDDQLKTLRNATKQSIHLIVIEGRQGIGKTLMLKEFHAGIRKIGTKSVYIDLGRYKTQHGYLDIISQVPNQVGVHQFSILSQALQELDQQFQGGKEASSEMVSRTNTIQLPSNAEISGVRSGGIDVARDLYAPFAKIAGRDMYNVVNITYMGAKNDRSFIQFKITNAFLECLSAWNPKSPFYLLLDHWEESNGETRSWVFDHLITWSLNEQIPGVVLVIACDCKPGWFNARIDTSYIRMPRLPDEAVRFFWVRLKGLPANIMETNKYFFGRPLLMSRLAQAFKEDQEVVE